MTDIMHRNFMPVNARLHAVLTSRNTKYQASPERRVAAAGAFIREHGVQPRVHRRDGGWMLLVTGTAARAQRVACSPAPPSNAAEGSLGSASSLVTFFWRSQKKVTHRGADSRGGAESSKGSRQKPPTPADSKSNPQPLGPQP